MTRRLITVIGAGALGSHLIQLIRNVKADIRVIDPDRVEQLNIASQFHGRTTIGQSKVDSLKRMMDFLWKRKIDGRICRLVDNNVDVLLKDASLVVDCVDNGATRRLIQAYVRQRGIPCVHGGLAADGAFGVVRWDSGFVVDDEPADGAATTCEGADHLPFIATVSGFLAQAVQAFLHDGRQVNFNVSPAGAQRW